MKGRRERVAGLLEAVKNGEKLARARKGCLDGLKQSSTLRRAEQAEQRSERSR